MPDAIADFIRHHHADQAAFLARLVTVPSDNPPGDCRPHAEAAATLLEDLGFTVERHAVPGDECRAAGMISAINLVVRRHFGDGPTIALNAHGDVVGPGKGWTHDPYGAEVDDGWMYGRGAAVSKSDFATYAYALLALEAADTPLAGTVELHFTYDEEVGGTIGPKWLLETGVTKPDIAISAGFSYAVVTAHNGCLHLEVEVTGKSAHAAQPETGHDALEAANAILSALYDHRQAFAGIRSGVDGIGAPSMIVGLIEGGINTNVVPDRVTLRLDRRIIPEEDIGSVEADLEAVVARAARKWDGITATVRRVLLARPLVPLPGVERLSGPLVRHASDAFATDVACSGVPLYTDARHYAAAGIPTVLYGAGPAVLTDANAHRADERVRLDDLHKATGVVARALADILAPA